MSGNKLSLSGLFCYFYWSSIPFSFFSLQCLQPHASALAKLPGQESLALLSLALPPGWLLKRKPERNRLALIFPSNILFEEYFSLICEFCPLSLNLWRPPPPHTHTHSRKVKRSQKDYLKEKKNTFINKFS